jgi:hypothetical protein
VGFLFVLLLEFCTMKAVLTLVEYPGGHEWKIKYVPERGESDTTADRRRVLQNMLDAIESTVNALPKN